MAGRDPWAGFGAGPASAGRYPSAGANGPRDTADDTGDDRAVEDLARRLQGRMDGHEALLDRVAELAQRADDRARIVELRDVARRVRRDSEALLLLCGADAGVYRGTPHTVSAVLGDAVALVDEPSRVGLRPAPSATLTATAAVELRHLVAELVDEAAAASPGARIEVGARLDVDGALLVDVVVAGRGWTDALAGTRRGGFGGGPRVAERLARRSSGGIRLHRPLIDEIEGLVATLQCPPVLITGHSGGDPWHLSPAPSLPTQPDASSLLLTPSFAATSRGDELFGPLPTTAGAVGTPIFEAVASAWFRDDERAPAGDDWNSPGDREWRAAAARATRTDVPPAITASGLPRRSPGDRLVPPPRASRQTPPPPDERVPERVRERLSTYQRGLRQGRHRAADDPVQADDPEFADPAQPQARAAEGW